MQLFVSGTFPLHAGYNISDAFPTSGGQFHVSDGIFNALKFSQVSPAITSSLALNAYVTGLAFNQSNVDAITADMEMYLIGAIVPNCVESCGRRCPIAHTGEHHQSLRRRLLPLARRLIDQRSPT